MSFIALGLMTSFRAAAQPPTMAFGVDFTYAGNVSYDFTVQQLTVGVTSSQPPAIFQPPNTFTNAGTFSSPVGLFLLGGYWVAPSLVSPLQISVGPGYTCVVKSKNAFSSVSVKVGIELANPNGTGLPTLIYGTPVSVPPLGTATLSVPTAAVTFTTATIPTIGTDPTYRIPIAFFITE